MKSKTIGSNAPLTLLHNKLGYDKQMSTGALDYIQSNTSVLNNKDPSSCI